MTNRYSSFPSKLDKLKVIPEFQEMSVQQWKSFAKWNEITSKGSNITQTDINELNALLKNDLRDVQITSTDWNLLSGSIMNLEDYIINHIFPDISKMVENKEQEFTNIVTNKTQYFDSRINSFQDMGIYNNNRIYNKNNFVHYDDGSGLKIYIALKDTQGITPSDDGITWRLITIKGDTGENGKDGLNLVFKGEWNVNTKYNANQVVLYDNDIFISMKDDNIGNSPQAGRNTEYWHKWKQVATTSTELKGVRKIVTKTKYVQFINCGEINVFNPSTDTLEVHCNTTIPIANVDYKIGQDNKSIEKAEGYWDGTKEPIWFEFVVKRNQINDLVFSDGQTIANNTISKNKLTIDVQKNLENIPILNSQYEDTTNKLNNFGGRNYLLNSSLSSLTHWSKRFQTNETNEKNKIEIKDNSCHIINTNQDLIGIYQNPADLDLNENYVLSFYVKCKKDSQMLVGFSDTGVSCLITHSEWKRKSVNIGKPSGQSVGCILYAKQGHEVYIKDVKLERGFVDTDWTLAPEEIIANSKRLDAIEKILIDKGYMTVTQKL